MASTIIEPIAQGIVDAIDAMTPDVKAYLWAPAGGALDRVPAAVVYTPTLERTPVGPDIPEDHLGSRDITLNYPATFYFGADDLAYVQAEIADVIDNYVLAIDNSMDAGQPLNGVCDDIKVLRVEEPGESTQPSNRKLWVVETRVGVVKFATY